MPCSAHTAQADLTPNNCLGGPFSPEALPGNCTMTTLRGVHPLFSPARMPSAEFIEPGYSAFSSSLAKNSVRFLQEVSIEQMLSRDCVLSLRRSCWVSADLIYRKGTLEEIGRGPFVSETFLLPKTASLKFSYWWIPGKNINFSGF